MNGYIAKLLIVFGVVAQYGKAHSPFYNYAPGFVTCPDEQLVRSAGGISEKEQAYVAFRQQIVGAALERLLTRLDIPAFDVGSFFEAANGNVPLIGLAFSGGGYRSLLVGAGALAAIDGRGLDGRGEESYEEINGEQGYEGVGEDAIVRKSDGYEDYIDYIDNWGSDSPSGDELDNDSDCSKTTQLGGLLQSTMYISGLSGGSWLIGSYLLNEMAPIEQMVDQVWNFEVNLALSDGCLSNGIDFESSEEGVGPGGPDNVDTVEDGYVEDDFDDYDFDMLLRRMYDGQDWLNMSRTYDAEMSAGLGPKEEKTLSKREPIAVKRREIVRRHGLNEVIDYYQRLDSEVAQKRVAGFSTSLTDYWSRALARKFIDARGDDDGVCWSDIVETERFQNGEAPFPIVLSLAYDPTQKIVTEDHRSADCRTSTIMEFTPFEFGSWDSRIDGFANIKHIGTRMNYGEPDQRDMCAQGFDHASFVMGASSSLFNDVLLFYLRHSSPTTKTAMAYVRELLLKMGADEIGRPFSEKKYALFTNPFRRKMTIAGTQEARKATKSLRKEKARSRLEIWKARKKVDGSDPSNRNMGLVDLPDDVTDKVIDDPGHMDGAGGKKMGNQYSGRRIWNIGKLNVKPEFGAESGAGTGNMNVSSTAGEVPRNIANETAGPRNRSTSRNETVGIENMQIALPIVTTSPDHRDLEAQTIGHPGDSFYDVSEILYLGDGGEDGQNLPLDPLFRPERRLDVVFAIDATADMNNYPNGSAIYRPYLRYEANPVVQYPIVPNEQELQERNPENRPVFFGCNLESYPYLDLDDDMGYPPLLIYVPNKFYTYPANTSTTKLTYSKADMMGIIDNGINVMLDGGREDWPKCVGCAIILRELTRREQDIPKYCEKCFKQYCYN